MIVHSINDLNLHDSELLEVVIKLDEVTLRLDYIEDYETMRCANRELVFRGCSETAVKMNPGYASPDSILGGNESPHDLGRKVRIEMNTTAAIIEIVAREIELV